MEIPGHKKRFVIIAALDVYGKALAAAKKATENAHVSTSAVDEMVVILEHLKAEYQESGEQLTFDGTPMGEALTRDHYRDDDGTDLTADALDTWMRQAAGLYVPFAVIAEWVLEKRKLVAAWLRSIELNVGEGLALVSADLPEGMELAPELRRENIEDARRIGRTCAPDFIDVAWFTPPKPAEELPLSTEDVDKWITAGPWGVQNYQPEGTAPGSDWELIKTDGTDAAVVIDRSVKVYPNLDTARQHAAKWNRDLAAQNVKAEPEVALHPA